MTVATLGEAALGISVLIKRTVRLVDRSCFVVFVPLGHMAKHRSAVCKVDAAFGAGHAIIRLMGHFDK